jgi:hypothetical protein
MHYRGLFRSRLLNSSLVVNTEGTEVSSGVIIATVSSIFSGSTGRGYSDREG